MRAQLSALIFPGFVAATGWRRLGDLVRYLRGIVHRLDRAPGDVGRDASRMEIVDRVSEDYEHVRAAIGPAARYRDDVKAVRWMIEELRVSLFAQPIGATIPVSEQRILAALDRVALASGSH
jgi:ATP-dependent helicase HrpA